MVAPVDVVNQALALSGSRVYVNSLTPPDNSPQAQVANRLYTSRVQGMLRAANWDFARAQQPLAVFKQAVVAGSLSPTPPPQPWLYEYTYPSDCLRGRFILPTLVTQATSGGVPLTTAQFPNFATAPAPTGIPFVIGTDKDQFGNVVKIILTNLPAAQLVYTRDLSQFPDTWDAQFNDAVTAFLAAWFINALARNASEFQQQLGIAKAILDEARVSNGVEGSPSVDHKPDWIAARQITGANWGYNGGGPGVYVGGWDSLDCPGGLRY